MGREVDERSFTCVRDLCGWVFLRVGLREYCVIVTRVVLCTMCSPSGVGEVMYQVGDVFIQFPGDYIS